MIQLESSSKGEFETRFNGQFTHVRDSNCVFFQKIQIFSLYFNNWLLIWFIRLRVNFSISFFIIIVVNANCRHFDVQYLFLFFYFWQHERVETARHLNKVFFHNVQIFSFKLFIFWLIFCIIFVILFIIYNTLIFLFFMMICFSMFLSFVLPVSTIQEFLHHQCFLFSTNNSWFSWKDWCSLIFHQSAYYCSSCLSFYLIVQLLYNVVLIFCFIYYLLIYLFICLFIYFFIYLFIYLLFYLFIIFFFELVWHWFRINSCKYLCYLRNKWKEKFWNVEMLKWKSVFLLY